MFWVVCDYSSSKLKDKQYKQKTSSSKYEIEIKILVNPRLVQSGFEQPYPLRFFSLHQFYFFFLNGVTADTSCQQQTSEKSSTKLKVKINLNLSATKQDGPTTVLQNQHGGESIFSVKKFRS